MFYEFWRKFRISNIYKKDCLIESKSLEKLSNPDKDDKNSSLYLLNEKYQANNQNNYPFYNYFYYSDYINEDYLFNQLSHKVENKYPALFKYVQWQIFTYNRKRRW